MQTPNRPAHAGYPEQQPALPGVNLSSTVEGLTVALQAHLAPEAWQAQCGTQTADEAAAALEGLLSAMAGEMPQALGQARERLQRNLDVSLVLQAQAQLAAMRSHDGAAAPTTPSFLQAAGEQAAMACIAGLALFAELEYAHQLIPMLLAQMTPAQQASFARASYQAGFSIGCFVADGGTRAHERAAALAQARNSTLAAASGVQHG